MAGKSNIKNKLTLRRTNSLNEADILTDADNVPQFDSSKLKQKDKIKVERMRHRD